MEEENQNKKRDMVLPVSIVIAAVIIAGAWIYTSDSPIRQKSGAGQASLSATLFPQKGVELPARWDGLGKKLIEGGAIDPQKFEALYQNRGGLSKEMKKMLYEDGNGNIKITPENSGVILNLLWALGLANKNPILENGPMMDPQYGGAGRFASTGGWTIAQSNAMDHYSKHSLVVLTPAQQELVEKVSKNIYRPCCDNATYFPDCNHGMAMLGLLELMASQGASEAEMYQAALAVNSYWFPNQYKDIARFLESKNIDWKKTSPEKLLGMGVSSASAYQQIASQLTQTRQPSGGGCGVEAGVEEEHQQPAGCAP